MSYYKKPFENGEKVWVSPRVVFKSNKSYLRRRHGLPSFGRKPKSKEIFSAYIDTVGPKVIFNRKVSFCRRFIWTVITITCLCLCSYQVFDRLCLYLKNPVTTVIDITLNTTVKYPSFTVCPFGKDSMPPIRVEQYRFANISKNKTVADVFYLLDFANFTSEEIWDLNQIDANNTNVGFVMKKSLPTEDFPTVTLIPRKFAFLGICMVIKIAGRVDFMGPAFVLRVMQQVKPNFNVENEADFTIYAHDDGTPALHHAFFKGLLVPRNQQMSIGLTVSTFNFINSSSKPCRDSITSAVCWTKCLEAILTSKTQCRLPFMTSKARNCTSSEESIKVYNATLTMYLTTKPSNCNCPSKCVDISYEMETDNQHKLKNLTILEIYFKTNKFREIREVHTYGFIAFVCEMGGNLGFYLGVSLLSILEIFEQLFSSARSAAKATK